MKYICTITLLVLCLTLLLLTGCMTNTVTPEIDNGNLENQAVEESVNEKVDTTKPVIIGTRSPLPNAAGWNNTDVTVTFTCEDVGEVQSGILTNTVEGATVTTEGKNQSITNTGECIDAVGNVADSVTVSGINIDKTSPVVTVILPKNGKYKLNESVTATWFATDILSGVEDSKAPKTIKINTKSKGWKNFTLPPGLVEDEAGNSSEEVTVTYEVVEGDSIEPDPVEEPGTEEPVEEPVIVDLEDPNTVYPQNWATGDGTESNPWANDCIKKAYNACPAGGTIFLSTGYYQLSAAVDIEKQINVIGEGRDKTIIKTADTYGFIVTTDHCTFKHFTIDGAAQTSGDKPIFNIHDCDYITVEDIEAKNSITCGIQNLNNSYSLYQNLYLHDNGEHGIHAGTLGLTLGTCIQNVYRNIWAWDNTKDGFNDKGTDNIFAPYQSNSVYDSIICWDNGRHGITLCYQKGTVLSNSSSTGSAHKGLYLKGLEDSTIENCSFIDSGTGGILISAALHNVNFTNVIVKNNGTGIGIYNSSNLVFTSCQSYDDRETPLQDWGIELQQGNSGISILNCKLSPNQYGDIHNPYGVAVTIITEKMLAKF